MCFIETNQAANTILAMDLPVPKQDQLCYFSFFGQCLIYIRQYYSKNAFLKVAKSEYFYLGDKRSGFPQDSIISSAHVYIINCFAYTHISLCETLDLVCLSVWGKEKEFPLLSLCVHIFTPFTILGSSHDQTLAHISKSHLKFCGYIAVCSERLVKILQEKRHLIFTLRELG